MLSFSITGMTRLTPAVCDAPLLPALFQFSVFGAFLRPGCCLMFPPAADLDLEPSHTVKLLHLIVKVCHQVPINGKLLYVLEKGKNILSLQTKIWSDVN